MTPTAEYPSAQIVKDYQIHKCELVNVAGKTIDVRYQMVQINVFEDIENATISGTLLVNDALNQIMNLPIVCFDTCNISFSSINKPRWTISFEIYKISEVQWLRDQQQVYMLHLVAREQITDAKTRVSKSYKGYLISDIVTDLQENWLDSSFNNIETTKYLQHIIIPNFHPMQAINWMATRANSATYNGASYLYYQDRDGFNFITAESLLAGPTVNTYHIQPGSVRKDTPEGYKPPRVNAEMKSLEVWRTSQYSDALDNMHSGMYGNEVYIHDLAKKSWAVSTFSYPDSFSEYKHLTPNPLWSTTRPDGRNAAAKRKFHSAGQSPFPFNPDSWLGVRISQLQQLHNVTFEVMIPGDTSKKVGQVLEIVLPSPEPLINDQQVLDKYYRGRYLISTVKHTVIEKSFTTTLTLVKDSVFSPWP